MAFRRHRYVCLSSITLVHPAKAVRWNEMPFARYICVVPSNIMLDGDPGRGDMGVETPVRSDAAYCQITLAFVFPFRILVLVDGYE